MRVTSPPKYHNQGHKSKSPLKYQPIQGIKNDKPVIHHLRSPSSMISNRTQTKNSVKQNLYAELKNREHEYVQLIKDLHQENKILKQQLVKLKNEQSHNPTHHLGNILTQHALSPKQQIVHNTYHSFNNVFKPSNMQSQRVLNRTFSNFTSPPRIVQPINTNLHSTILVTNRSPFSKKQPIIMSNTSPQQFRPKTFVRNNSPCIRPLSNFSPNAVAVSNPITRTEIRTVNHSYQPSLMSYRVSNNQSLIQSPKKKTFQIINVLNAAVKSSGPNQIVFKQTDDTSEKSENHLNPLTSKRHRESKSVRFESPKKSQGSQKIPQNQQKQMKDQQSKQMKDVQQQMNFSKMKCKQQILNENVNLDMKIEQSQLLNMLRQRLQQQGDFLNKQIKEQQIEQSECVDFIKPSEYNQNIRYSTDDLKMQMIQQAYVIHPLRRNLLEGFPILNNLRMAHSSYQQDGEAQIQPLSQAVQIQSNTNNTINDPKTQISLHSQSEVSQQSRLSQKISKQNISKPVIEQPSSHRKPLTIIRMLEENMNQKSQTHSFINDHIFETVQKIQSLTNIHENKPGQSANFISMPKQSIKIIDQRENSQSAAKILNEKSSQKSQKQQSSVFLQKPQNFTNKMYCQSMTEQSIKFDNQSEQKIKEQTLKQSQRSIKSSNKLFPVNNMSDQIGKQEVVAILSSQKVIQKAEQLGIQFKEDIKQSKQNNFTNNASNPSNSSKQIQNHSKSFDLKNLPKDYSIQVTEEQLSNYQKNYTQDCSVKNLSQKQFPVSKSKKDYQKLQASVNSQMNKTSPINLHQQEKTFLSKNRKYLEAHSLTTNQWQSSSTSTFKSQRNKRITNQVYL